MELLGLSIDDIKPYALKLSELQDIVAQITLALNNVNALIAALQTQGVNSTDELA